MDTLSLVIVIEELANLPLAIDPANIPFSTAFAAIVTAPDVAIVTSPVTRPQLHQRHGLKDNQHRLEG